MKLLTLLTVINEDVYHTTGRDVDEFRPLSHFGTAKAARDRARHMDLNKEADDRGPLRTYRASLDIKNPVYLHDYGHSHDNVSAIVDGILMWYNGSAPKVIDLDRVDTMAFKSFTTPNSWYYNGNDIVNITSWWSIE